jgi:hypothetical protein
VAKRISPLLPQLAGGYQLLGVVTEERVSVVVTTNANSFCNDFCAPGRGVFFFFLCFDWKGGHKVAQEFLVLERGDDGLQLCLTRPRHHE